MVVKKKEATAEESKEHRAPTHNIRMLPRDKRCLKVATIGVGWYNEEKDSFSIRLNPGTTITWRDDEDYTLIAFPKPPPAKDK